MKIIKFLYIIWQFIAHAAYVVTKIDELIEQGKTFWKWLIGEDDEEDKN
jgi:hypothetical protein